MIFTVVYNTIQQCPVIYWGNSVGERLAEKSDIGAKILY